MKSIDMKQFVVYRVIKASTDKTMEEGMLIWLSNDNNLNSKEGALSESEWKSPETIDFEVESAADYYIERLHGDEIMRRRTEIDEILEWLDNELEGDKNNNSTEN